MASLKDEAKAYQPKTTRNIAELDKVPLDLAIEDRVGKDQNGKDFKYKVAIIGEDEFRVPATVLNDIKTIISSKPDLKSVKVVKKGSGMNTDYTVIPLD